MKTPRLVHFDLHGDWVLDVVVIRRMVIIRLRWLWVCRMLLLMILQVGIASIGIIIRVCHC